jgi:PKD repeat protein
LCSDTTYKTIILNKLPEAGFSIDSKTGCEGKEIQFTNKSKNATSYLWDFDNGSTSNTEHPLATFSTQGIYFPYLVAYNKTGCSDTAYYSDTIKIRPNPVTDFSWEAIDKGPEERGNYRFINLSQGANIFQWDFDDGDTSMAVNPVHRFSERGDYAITLKTTNEYGCSTQLSKYLTVNILKGLYIPTALAPGNPNPEVRLFTPKGKGLLSYHLAIYDSWGNIIWETTALDNGEPVESWDGTYKGKPVPQGVYYWHAEAVFEDNTIWQGMVLPDGQQITKGSVTVLR